MLIKDLNFILERERRLQRDQKEVGQYPDIADYMRLFNRVDDLIKTEEKKRRYRNINRLKRRSS